MSFRTVIKIMCIIKTKNVIQRYKNQNVFDCTVIISGSGDDDRTVWFLDL